MTRFNIRTNIRTRTKGEYPQADALLAEILDLCQKYQLFLDIDNRAGNADLVVTDRECYDLREATVDLPEESTPLDDVDPDPGPTRFGLYRHRRTRGLYLVEELGRTAGSKGATVHYRGVQDLQAWSRALSEWESLNFPDGTTRYERIKATVASPVIARVLERRTAEMRLLHQQVDGL